MDISIVIPVYKVENYIRECLDSIVKQENENIEVIAIDDGSPDNSGKICDEYASKYSFIRVIHKENGGVSTARNLGVKEAKGKYIMFLDSDDLLSDGIIEIVSSKIKSDCDMYTFNFCKITSEGKSISENIIDKIEDGIYEKNVLLKNHYDKFHTFPWNVWQSVYKAEIIKKNNIEFPIGIKAAEDTDFYMKYIEQVEKIEYSNTLIIQYRLNRDGSAMSSMKSQTILNVFSIYSKYFYGNDKFISEYFAKFYIVAFTYLSRIEDKNERKIVLDAIDSKIVKSAKGLKFNIFKIAFFILGKERSINILRKIY